VILLARANWSKDETDIFIKVYPFKTSNELAEIFPQYNNTQLNRKAKQLGIKKMKEVVFKSRLQNSIIQRNDLWTDDEKKVVIEHYPTLGALGVKELLNGNRSEEQIKKLAYRIGISREQPTLMWEQTDIKFKEDAIFSVEVTYKGR
jgi:hypothetical protein